MNILSLNLRCFIEASTLELKKKTWLTSASIKTNKKLQEPNDFFFRLATLACEALCRLTSGRVPAKKLQYSSLLFWAALRCHGNAPGKPAATAIILWPQSRVAGTCFRVFLFLSFHARFFPPREEHPPSAGVAPPTARVRDLIASVSVVQRN